MQLTDEQRKAIEWAIGMASQHNIHNSPLRALLAAHSAGAQEPEWCERCGYPCKCAQPLPQTDAARDAEDAKRYRFIKSQMKVGAVQTQLPLYRSLHWIGYEDCSDVRNADAAIDAEIERIDRAKGER